MYQLALEKGTRLAEFEVPVKHPCEDGLRRRNKCESALQVGD